MGSLIEGWCDGVCEPVNPGGHAAYGALLKVDGAVVWQEGCYVGHGPAMSNNVAEYSGAIALLQQILDRKLRGCVILRGDSKLVMCQLGGNWKVHGGLYVPFYRRAKKLTEALRRQVDGNLKFCWIPREENSECDVLSKQELHKRGVQFKIQPEEALTCPRFMYQ